MSRCTLLALAAAPLVLVAACERAAPTEATPSTDLAATANRDGGKHGNGEAPGTMTVVATGLTNPRGLAFGRDGSIYVAEAGTGGTNSTAEECDQVPPPIGPQLGGRTGRISRIDRQGTRTTVVDALPSSVDATGNAVGPADVAFVGRKLYVLVTAGCSHGETEIPSSVLRIRDGGWTVAADLTAFVEDHPVAHPEEEDFVPGGEWYSMVAVGEMLFAVEANGGQLVAINPNSGRVRRVVDISASQGHIVPTAVESAGDAFLVGNLETFPAVAGDAKILRISRNGRMQVAATGFTTILGLAMRDGKGRGHDRALYVLESFTCPDAPLPCVPAPFAAGRGRVVRVSEHGEHHVIADGLTFPTSLRFGPDGALYVSNKGYGAAPGEGEVVRIALGW